MLVFTTNYYTNTEMPRLQDFPRDIFLKLFLEKRKIIQNTNHVWCGIFLACINHNVSLLPSL